MVNSTVKEKNINCNNYYIKTNCMHVSMVNSTVEVKNINCNNYYIKTNCTYQW